MTEVARRACPSFVLHLRRKGMRDVWNTEPRAVSRAQPPRDPSSGLAGIPRPRAWTIGSGCAPWPGRPAGGSPKAKNCILIWLAGGPSHLDTFDPKPGAAADVRGEFKPIATSVPGLSISEVFPEPGQGHEQGHADPEHDLARIRPRPGRPSPDDRLPPVAGPGLSRAMAASSPRRGSRRAGCCRRTSPYPTRRSSARADT